MKFPFQDNTQAVKDIVSVNASFDIADLKPYMKRVVRSKIYPTMSQEMYAELMSEFNNPENAQKAHFSELIELTQEVIIFFAILEALPWMEVSIGAQGVTRNESDNEKSAYKQQVTRLENSCKKLGFDALEQTFELLEKHKETSFVTWTKSEVYDSYNQNFIRSAKELSQYVPINSNQFIFNKLKPEISKVQENVIKGLLGEKLYNKVLAKHQGGKMETFYKDLIALIKPCIAHLAFSFSMPYLISEIGFDGVNYIKESTDNDTKKAFALPEIRSMLERKNENDGYAKLNEIHEFLQKNIQRFSDFEFSEYYKKDAHEVYRSPENSKTVLF